MGACYRPVTHVIFDMDGLLMNTTVKFVKARAQICHKYGAEFSDEVRMLTMGRTAKEAAEAITKLCNLPITPEEFIKEMNDIYPEIFAEYIELMPGAQRLVEHLKNYNIPICIATSSNSTLKYKEKQHGEFFKLFNHLVKGTDAKNGKPAPDIFLVAAERFNPPPVNMNDVLVFEDAVSGVQAGLAAGMQVVWVPPSYVDRSEANPTLTISSLEEFKPELFGLPPFESSN